MAITNAKEVKAGAGKLGLEEPLTVYSISIQAPMKGLPHLPAFMRDLTMDQALDAISTTFGVLIVFGECTSRAGVHFFGLDVIGPFDVQDTGGPMKGSRLEPSALKARFPWR